MSIPKYKGIDSIPEVLEWFMKSDTIVDLQEIKQFQDALVNYLKELFRSSSKNIVKESINVTFHSFTFNVSPQLRSFENRSSLTMDEQNTYRSLYLKSIFQLGQLRVAGWLYKQLFHERFVPYGNTIDVLGSVNGFVNYYAVLGVSSAVSQEELRKAYRAKIKVAHPDVGGNAEQFKRIRQAYDCLSDPVKRDSFDQQYKYYQTFYAYDEGSELFSEPGDVKQQEKEDFKVNEDNEPASSQSSNGNEKDKSAIKKESHSKLFIFKCARIAKIAAIILICLCAIAWFDQGSSQITYSSQDTAQTTYSNQSTTQTTTSEDLLSYVTLGSTKDDVINIMGEPDSKEQYGNVSDWDYGNSTIGFDENGKVANWTNNGDLKVSLGTKKNNAKPFSIGSSQDDVIDAMGTPDKITHYGVLWYYSNSTVEFDDGIVNFLNNASGNLKVNSSTDSTDSIEIIDFSSVVSPGSYAYLTAQVEPGATAHIEVDYNSGPSTAAGLIPEIAESSGKVTWRWKVGTRTAYGTYRIIVSTDSQSTTTMFTVQ